MTALFEYMTALLEYFNLLLSTLAKSSLAMTHLPNGYSLGVPLGYHRLHRNVYLIVGMTSFNDEKLPGGFLREFSRNKAIDRL